MFQLSSLWVIQILRDCPVSDFLDSFINYKKRDKKPFARSDRIAESISNLDIQSCGRENSMDQVLESSSVNALQLVGSDNLHIGHEKSRVEPGVGNSPLNIAACHPDLMN